MIINKWANSRSFNHDNHDYFEIPHSCPWCDCKHTVNTSFWEEEYDGSLSEVWVDYQKCLLCGWSWKQKVWKDFMPKTQIYTMKSFNINSLNVSLAELGTFLKNNFTDPSSLSWERFEDLTNDVLKQYGYETIQTARTHDNGADVLLIGSNGKVEGIVECKKYANNRPIGISAVRELIGSAILWETKKTYLVTSSRFTTFSKKAVDQYKKQGYELNLIDSTEFLKHLSVYNEQLPDLSKINNSKKLEIIEYNTNLFKNMSDELFMTSFKF